MDPKISELMAAARAARDSSYAPYSHLHVGAAIRGASGKIYTGCNVENSAYPEGTCAEAGAVAAMILAGEQEIAEVAIAGSGSEPTPPCGGCRQKLSEFAGETCLIAYSNGAGDIDTRTLGELLPGAFSASNLDSND